MKHKISNYKQYLESLASEEERILVESLHAIALKHLPAFKETFLYGFPVYDGLGKFGFAIKKNHVSIYFHHHKAKQLIDKYGKELGKFDFGKDTLRFKNVSDVPIQVIEKIVVQLFK